MVGEILPTWGQIGVLGAVIMTLLVGIVGTRRAWVSDVAAQTVREAAHGADKVRLAEASAARLERLFESERAAHERTREELMRVLRTAGDAET